MNTYAIETTQLSKKHKNTYRVKNLNLKVPQNCVYGFLGPNGAGKTTTIKLLLGLIKPQNGSIHIMNTEMNEKNRLSLLQHTGSLIESPSFYGHLSGQQNMEIMAKYKNISQQEVSAVLKLMRLYEQKDKKVKYYSMGMKQRLGIGMALLGKPDILILDEPTNGLDPAGIQEIRTFIKELPEKYHMTVIVSSHLLSEIEQMAQYVGIINHGEMVFQGPLDQLKEDGQNLEDVFLQLTGGAKSL